MVLDAEANMPNTSPGDATGAEEEEEEDDDMLIEVEPAPLLLLLLLLALLPNILMRSPLGARGGSLAALESGLAAERMLNISSPRLAEEVAAGLVAGGRTFLVRRLEIPNDGCFFVAARMDPPEEPLPISANGSLANDDDGVEDGAE